MVAFMNVLLTYRGRSVTDADAAFLRKLIADNPALNRRALSQEVCRAWEWRQANGVLKEGVCRSLMLQLHRAGHIELPPPRAHHGKRVSRRWRAVPVPIDGTPLRASLCELQPLSFREVRRTVHPAEACADISPYRTGGFTPGSLGPIRRM